MFGNGVGTGVHLIQVKHRTTLQVVQRQVIIPLDVVEVGGMELTKVESGSVVPTSQVIGISAMAYVFVAVHSVIYRG